MPHSSFYLNNMPRTTLAWRVERLEKAFEKLDDKIDKFMTNDWPHFQQAMNKQIYALKIEMQGLKKEIHINKWKIAIIIGVASALGSSILGAVFQGVLSRMGL